MEPNNKLEQQFKDKLEQRTIMPTEMAWDRLDAMLTVAEGKKKPNRNWMYMAASFLALLLVGVLFLNQEKQGGKGTINDNTNVVTTAPQPEDVTKENSTIPQGAQEQAVAATAVSTTPVNKATKREATYNYTASQPKNNDNLATGTIAETAITNAQPQNDRVTAGTIKVNASALLASVDKPRHVNGPTLSNPQIKQEPVKVDVGSLLSSVEGELNDNFRSKALQGVVKNINVVRVAVANRNHQ